MAGRLYWIVVRAHLLSSWGDYQALFYQTLVQVHIEILIDLLVIDEAKIAMIGEVVRFNAVNRIDGAPLELVDVAGDDFGTLLSVRDQQSNLVPIGKFA